MAAIHKALDECSTEHPVFYEDEVDIHLHPKIGTDWQLHGQQNGWSRRDRMKNIIRPERCTAGQVKSAMWAATAKFGAVHQPAEAAESDIPSGENHHADRGQQHYPQKPGNTALAEGEPEVQGHLSAGLLAMGKSC